MRLYSPAWVAAFNEAVADVAVPDDASFRMVQIVHGSPEGTLRVELEASDSAVKLTVDPSPAPEPHVQVSIGYQDAAALARGELDPGQLLKTGRVKVRGDLSVLVRGQAMLAEAAGRLEGLSERTTT